MITLHARLQGIKSLSLITSEAIEEMKTRRFALK